MPSGKVKFFNEAKGFGFIAPDGGGTDVFVHISALQRSGLSALNEGDLVAYELEADRRSGKLAAVDVPPNDPAGRGSATAAATAAATTVTAATIAMAAAAVGLRGSRWAPARAW
jgi:CspA family cold shock protein